LATAVVFAAYMLVLDIVVGSVPTLGGKARAFQQAGDHQGTVGRGLPLT
jgi:hypothetical protein